MKAIVPALVLALAAPPLMASDGDSKVTTDQIRKHAAGPATARATVGIGPEAPSLAAWSQRVMANLNQGMRVRDDLGAQGPREGIVAVKFNCSETGAPAGVELLDSSGNREYDRAAVRAVRRIASLHPLPTGLGHDQKYIVRVLFANSEYSAKQKIARMRREAESNNAWYMKTGTSTAALELAPTG